MRISDWSSDVCSSDLMLSLRQQDADDGGRQLLRFERGLEQLEKLFHGIALRQVEVIGNEEGAALGQQQTARARGRLHVLDEGARHHGHALQNRTMELLGLLVLVVRVILDREVPEAL